MKEGKGGGEGKFPLSGCSPRGGHSETSLQHPASYDSVSGYFKKNNKYYFTCLRICTRVKHTDFRTTGTLSEREHESKEGACTVLFTFYKMRGIEARRKKNPASINLGSAHRDDHYTIYCHLVKSLKCGHLKILLKNHKVV